MILLLIPQIRPEFYPIVASLRKRSRYETVGFVKCQLCIVILWGPITCHPPKCNLTKGESKFNWLKALSCILQCFTIFQALFNKDCMNSKLEVEFRPCFVLNSFDLERSIVWQMHITLRQQSQLWKTNMWKSSESNSNEVITNQKQYLLLKNWSEDACLSSVHYNSALNFPLHSFGWEEKL